MFKMEDYNTDEVAVNVEKAQKQFFDGLEQMVKMNTTFVSQCVKAWRDSINNINGQVAKVVKPKA